MLKVFIPILVVVALALPAAAVQPQNDLELSPWDGIPYDGTVIDVESPDVEVLYFHIVEPGLWHVKGTSFHWEVVSGDPATANVELIAEDVTISTEYQGSHWYPFGTIQVTGEYCTTVSIQIDLTLQEPTGTIWSNPIYKHIIPEPASMLLLAVGAGAALLKRRRA